MVLPLLLGILFAGSHATAQAEGSGSEISLFLGSMLPNQIDGVTEILPVFGGRYGYRTSSVAVLEFAATNTHAEGVDFTTLSGTIRADLPSIDQFVGFLSAGVDLHYYSPVGASERRAETGVHVGTGLLMHVGDTLWLRTDLKFMAQPGTALQVLFGLVFRPN